MKVGVVRHPTFRFFFLKPLFHSKSVGMQKLARGFEHFCLFFFSKYLTGNSGHEFRGSQVKMVIQYDRCTIEPHQRGALAGSAESRHLSFRGSKDELFISTHSTWTQKTISQ
jgi:hypothetical protein